MSKCFISYARNDSHLELVDELDRFLSDHGHDVFRDTRIPPGANWPDEIEKHLVSSRYFIVFISQESIRSDMVREEVKRAYELYKEKPDRYTIIAIRLDYDGSLPFDLAAYLYRIQYMKWKPGDDFNKIAQQVLALVGGGSILERREDEPGSVHTVNRLFEVSEKLGAPLPSADYRLPRIEMETGTITLESPFYVRRESDDEMEKQLEKTGTTTIIKGARQMGKSSLLARARAQAISRGQRVFYFDFQALDKPTLADAEKFCHFLSWELYEQLKPAHKPEDCWKKHRPPMLNLTRFIEEGLLKNNPSGLTLLFDEVDRLFGAGVGDDFFSIIRSWHNSRAADDACWKRFNIVLAHSTEPYLWIKDMNRSPFNVGLQVKLRDFGVKEAGILNERHGNVLKTDAELDYLLSLTGGQLYLVRQAFYTMASKNISLPELEKKAAAEDGPFADHLHQFSWLFKDDRGMMRALKDVLEKGAIEDEEKFLRLRAGGLIKGESKHKLEMRCRLYRDYFKRHL